VSPKEYINEKIRTITKNKHISQKGNDDVYGDIKVKENMSLLKITVQLNEDMLTDVRESLSGKSKSYGVY
jgi:hypothetical protein